MAGDPDGAFRFAGLRETAEEIGVLLTTPAGLDVDPTGDIYAQIDRLGARMDTDRLIYLSNWVTPRLVPKRFDTRFYLARIDPGAEPRPVSDEFREVRWVSARAGLIAAGRNDMPMIFPTLAHLRYLAGFDDVASLVAEIEATPSIPQIEPRMFERGGKTVIEVTGDDRFRR